MAKFAFSRLLFVLLLGGLSTAAERYTGPRPPKPDVPYLVHADNLVPTEVSEAREEKQKDGSTYIVAGATSSARTPMAEPIFIMDSRNLSPERLSLYRMEVRNGNREVSVRTKGRRGGLKPLRVTVSRLSDNLYRIEVSEMLENGEYTLSPEGSNQVFAFTVY